MTISEEFAIAQSPGVALELINTLKTQNAKLRSELSNIDYEYPRDIFHEIRDKSPYAFYLFQWVPYQTDARQWRLKMNHDVKTFDGREELGIWPNGSHCGSFKDEEIEFIRISKKQHGDDYIDPRDKEDKE